MVRNGFWPLSPKQPQVGVAIDLMQTLQCLTLEGQISFKSFRNALALKNKLPFSPYRVSIFCLIVYFSPA